MDLVTGKKINKMLVSPEPRRLPEGVLLLPLLDRLRPYPFDGDVDQFHRIHPLIAADRNVIDLRNYILPLHHYAEDRVLAVPCAHGTVGDRSEEHTSELQSPC